MFFIYRNEHILWQGKVFFTEGAQEWHGVLDQVGHLSQEFRRHDHLTLDGSGKVSTPSADDRLALFHIQNDVILADDLQILTGTGNVNFRRVIRTKPAAWCARPLGRHMQTG